MMRRTLLITAVVSAALHGDLHGQTPPPARTTLWVTLGDIDELVEVDPYTFKEIDRTGDLAVIDTRRRVEIGRVHVGNDPNQITLTRDGRFAYVPLRDDNEIAVVELNPLRVVKKLPVAKGPHDAYTSDDGSRIYVGAQFGNGIIAIDPAAQSVLYTIPTADGVRPLAIAPDGKTVYAALSHLIGFVVADPATHKVTRTVELATIPPGVPEPYLATFTHSLMLSPDAKELWVTDCVNYLIRIVRLSDMREISQIRVGKFPHWFAMRADGQSGVREPLGFGRHRRHRRREPEGAHERPVHPGTGPKRIMVASKQ